MPQDLMERDIAGAETSVWSIRRLYALEDAQIDGLADRLIDCVEGGAPVSFLYPLPHQRAAAFWQHVAQGVAAGERALLVACCRGAGSATRWCTTATWAVSSS